jgi:type VI secretion system secreted protein VgrG
MDQRNIRVKTPLGEDLLFEQMSGTEELGRPFTYELSLLSEKLDLDLSALLGQAITVELDLFHPGMKRHWNGHVTDFGMVGLSRRHMRYSVTIRPWISLLSLNSNCRIFQNKTTPDIVKQIWREQGFTDFRESLTGNYRKWDYRVQYRESDFNFTSRLLEQEGIYYYFEHEDGKHTLVLADGPDAHKSFPNYDTVPFFPPGNELRRKQDHLSAWALSRRVRPGSFTHTDYDFKRPKADLTAKLKAPLPHEHSSFEVFDYPGDYEQNSDGEQYSRVRLEEHQADYEVARASGNVMGLGAGALFKLEDYPRDDQNKQYLVVSASHRLHTNPRATSDGGEMEVEGQYAMIDGTRQFRAPASTPKPRVDGPQTAKVVGKAGEEIWTDEHARVKVQFPWDREGQSDENSSCWVRVVQSWAGSKWGAQFLPRIGQEVLIDFLEGDPDRPIVTGRVYNGTNMPPYELPANQTQSGIKTRSSKGGTPENFNEIRFEDKKGSELLSVQAEKDQTTLVKHDQTTTVKNDKHVDVAKKYDLKVGEEYDITVGQVHINAKKDGTLSIQAMKKVEIQCGTTMVTLDGMAGNVTVMATTGITLSCGAGSVQVTPMGTVLS